MASDNRKRGAAPGETSADSRNGLDEILGSLAKRGLLDGDESRIPEIDSLAKGDVERTRKEVLRVGLRILFQRACVPMRDVWFGHWLKLVRCRTNVRHEEVSELVGVDALVWRVLEEKPLQVTGLQPQQLVEILDLFNVPLPKAEPCMRKGLAQGSSHLVFARTSAALPDIEWKARFSAIAASRPTRALGAQAALDRLLQGTRQLLEAKGRRDLLDDRLD